MPVPGTVNRAPFYHADIGGGKDVWAFTWADKIYIRSIQARDKNNPPYDP